MEFNERITKDEFDALARLDISSVAWKGCEILKPLDKDGNQLENLIVLATLSYFTRKYDLCDEDELHAFVHDNIHDGCIGMLLDTFSAGRWREIRDFAQSAQQRELKAVILFQQDSFCKFSGVSDTSDSIIRLVAAIMDIQDDDDVLDMCSGNGSFLGHVSVGRSCENAYDGIEINQSAINISKIRSLILGNSFHVDCGDVLRINRIDRKYDKVFSDPPMGMYHNSIAEFMVCRELFRFLPEQINPRMVEYMTLLLPVLHQENGGRTVVATARGLLFRVSPREVAVRENIIRSGKLEAIITLPAAMRHNTMISTVLWVFSEHNTCVRFVDAEELGEKNGKKCVLSDRDIDIVMEALHGGNTLSRCVSNDEIAVNKYVLEPKKYLNDVSVENGVKLSELQNRQIRGINIKSDQISEDPISSIRYLMLKNIKDGTVSLDMPYVSDNEGEVARKYCRNMVHEGDLLISRTAPFKIAVMPESSDMIVANGNLYSMTLDTRRINPLYAMLYLNSEDGMRQLDIKCKGGSGMLPNLSRDDLESIEIPMIPLEEQTVYVEQYLRLLSELHRTEMRVNELRDAMYGIL